MTSKIKREICNTSAWQKKGRMQERVKEHLPTSTKDPVKSGSKVEITTTKTKEAALKKERLLIKSKRPPQNKI